MAEDPSAATVAAARHEPGTCSGTDLRTARRDAVLDGLGDDDPTTLLPDLTPVARDAACNRVHTVHQRAARALAGS